MHLIGVHQELRAILIHRQAEMVRHRLVIVELHRPAEGRGHVDTLLPMGEVRFGGSLQHGSPVI